MAPRVLVDATDVPADRGALGRYVDGLIGALGAAGRIWPWPASSPTRSATVGCAGRHDRGGPGRARAPDRRLAWEQSGLPVVAQQVGADVIHMPYYSMPLRPGLPTVVTIHDVTFFTEPERYTPVARDVAEVGDQAAARQATRLIVPSKATRDELVRVLGIDPARIDVAYHGVDHQPVPPARPGAGHPGDRAARPARQAVRRVPRLARRRARTRPP